MTGSFKTGVLIVHVGVLYEMHAYEVMMYSRRNEITFHAKVEG